MPLFHAPFRDKKDEKTKEVSVSSVFLVGGFFFCFQLGTPLFLVKNLKRRNGGGAFVGVSIWYPLNSFNLVGVFVGSPGF